MTSHNTRSLRRALAPFAIAAACTLPAASPLASQDVTVSDSGFALTVPNIMRGPEHYGRSPQQVRWTADNRWLYFRWAPAGSAWNAPTEWFRVRPEEGSTPEEVSAAHADSVAPLLASGPLTRNGRTRAVASGGDLWLVDTRRGTARRLTETVANESDPRFSTDERQLLFVRDGNAFALELASGAVRQLTDVRAGPAPRDSAPPAGQRGALRRDQTDLLD